MLGKPQGRQGWGLHSPDKWGGGKQRSHGGPGTHQQRRCCRGGKNGSSELSSCVRFTEAQGVGGGACGSHPVLRDSEALPEEPPGQALIQWFPNACDHEPFLGGTSVSSRGSGTQSGKPAPLLRLEESGRGTWSLVLLPVCGGSGELGQPRPRLPLPGGVGGEVETASQLGRQGCCSWKVILLGPSIDRLICWLIDLLVFIDSLPPFTFPVPPACQAGALWDLKGWKARPAVQGPLVSEVWNQLPVQVRTCRCGPERAASPETMPELNLQGPSRAPGGEVSTDPEPAWVGRACLGSEPEVWPADGWGQQMGPVLMGEAESSRGGQNRTRLRAPCLRASGRPSPLLSKSSSSEETPSVETWLPESLPTLISSMSILPSPSMRLEGCPSPSPST